jgi:hypothetical protein
MNNVAFFYMYRGLRPKMTIRIFIKVMGLAFLE